MELYYLRGPGQAAAPPPPDSWDRLDSPAARALQPQHVAAVIFALEHLGSALDNDTMLPVLGSRLAPEHLRHIAQIAPGAFYDRLKYPIFAADLKEGLAMLLDYDLLIVESAALTDPAGVSTSWRFHHAFRQAWQAGRLAAMGVHRLGEVRILGRDMTVFALAKS